jgi:hypothetical protein
MHRQSARNVGLALGVFVALVLAATPAFASGTTGQPVQYPATGVGNWNSIGSQSLEFRLAYPGNDEGAEIQLASDPSSRVGFAVYTDWAWTQLGAGNTDVKPVGMGTPNPDAGGNLTWKVRTHASELYHIQVYLIGMDSAAFWINQQGSGNSVLWAVSPLQVQPTTQVVASAPAPVIVVVPFCRPCGN